MVILPLIIRFQANLMVSQMIESSVIAASAGSGKTYTVTTELLKLIVHSYSKLNDILVTTFTKKAAQEIFERLITRILTCLDSESQLEILKREVAFENLTKEILRDRLYHLIKNQNKLKIQTIDSFLVSIAQNFPADLSLPIGWKVADTWESELLDKKIILETIERIGAKNLRLILPLVFKNKFSSKTFSAIEKELHSLFKDIVLYEKNAWQLSTVEHFTDDPHYNLQEFTQIIQSLVDSGEVNQQLNKSFLTLIQHAQNNEWEDLLSTTLSQKARIGDYSFNRKKLPEKIVPILNSITTHATYKLARSLHEQSIGLGAIYSTFDMCRQELQRESGLLTFNDITLLLSKSQIKEKLNEIYFKLDSKINFVFIDEFQDTSASQWIILNPLVQEILQDNTGRRIFTAVGDSKQAIYGWRGGLHDIFGFIKEQCSNLNEKILAKSYRSEKHIIDFVNQVFTDPVLPNRYTEVRELWKENFNTHVAHSDSDTGRIHISKIEYTRDSTEVLQKRLEKIKEYVESELISNPDSKIGILTRTNTQALSIEKYLKDKNIDASSISSNELSSFVEIQLLISYLTLALHPRDILSYVHLENYLPELVDSKDRKELSRVLLEKIYMVGLCASVQYVFDLLLAKGYPLRCDIEYVLNLAKGLERKRGNEISHFIKILSTAKTQDTALSKINILTIHKSKGLEFDHVIIPFCGGNFFREDDFYLLKEQDSPFESPHAIVKNCKKNARPFIPQIDTLTEQARLMKVSEALCLSYVAITRAKKSLSIILESNTSSDKASLGSLLLNTLNLDIHKDTMYTLGTYPENKSYGDLQDIRTTTVSENMWHKEIPTRPLVINKIDRTEFSQTLPLVSPSRIGTDSLTHTPLYSEVSESSRLGIEIHSVLSKLNKNFLTTEDLMRDAELLLERDNASMECSKIVKNFLQTTAAHDIFLHDENCDRIVITEFSISEIYKNKLYAGRIDRIHLHMRNSIIEKIEIYDYKLGNVNKNEYELQLATYKQLAAIRFKVSSGALKTHLVRVL